jgi:hypothetical protein
VWNTKEILPTPSYDLSYTYIAIFLVLTLFVADVKALQ